MSSRRFLVVELPPSFPDALSPVLDRVCQDIGAVVHRAAPGHEGLVAIRYRFEPSPRVHAIEPRSFEYPVVVGGSR